MTTRNIAAGAVQVGDPTPVMVGKKQLASRKLGEYAPKLLLTQEHALCAGCGEPIAMRIMLEVLEELGVADRSIAAVGIGCYTMFSSGLDIDVVQALHGRAPSVATGVKRMLPDKVVLTIQGDGDMVNEGLQEVVHTAARGENVTAILLNNGVFGETGGQMTAATALGQRTKNTLEGRNADTDGYPIRISDIVSSLDGTAYVGRGTVNSPGTIAKTKKMIRKAFQSQIAGEGFSLVEILTMCPTGWFIKASQGPSYIDETLGRVHTPGELRG